MTAYRDMSREELLELKSRLEKEFEDVKGKGRIFPCISGGFLWITI